jgi:Peptidase propeptide and YPEB domain
MHSMEPVMKLIATTIAALSFGIAASAFAQDQIATTGGNSAPGAAARATMGSPRGDRAERRETVALNLLEAAGYGQYTDFKNDGGDYSAMVMKDGERLAVRVDPDKGTVTLNQ